MKKWSYLIVFLGIFACSKATPRDWNQSKKILAILAHPDDETAFAQTLAKFAREGNPVQVIIASDGGNGMEEHAGIQAGESLAKIRKEETICGCNILGTEPPIFLGANDGMGIYTGIGEYLDQNIQIKNELEKLIPEIKPDVILTFGPEGDTGHVDHKGIGNLVTEVILRNEGWYEKFPLYYLTWPKEKEFWMPQGEMTGLNYVSEKYRNVHIRYTSADHEKLFQALECYQSQYTPEDIQKWILAEKKDTTFTQYFREFKLDPEVKHQF